MGSAVALPTIPLNLKFGFFKIYQILTKIPIFSDKFKCQLGAQYIHLLHGNPVLDVIRRENLKVLCEEINYSDSEDENADLIPPLDYGRVLLPPSENQGKLPAEFVENFVKFTNATFKKHNENVKDSKYDGLSIGAIFEKDFDEYGQKFSDGKERDWFERLRDLFRREMERWHANGDWNQVVSWW